MFCYNFLMKLLKLFFVVCIVVVFVFIQLLNADKYKVLDVPDYKTVIIDINKNFQIDNNETITFDELYIPADIYKEDQFLLNYLATKEANHILLGKFVDYSPETKTITVNDKDFVSLMTDTHLVLNSNNPDETSFKQKLEALKSQNYVLVNNKSKRYHKLNCDSGITSKNYKLIPMSYVTNDLIPCKSCIDIENNIKEAKKTTNKQEITVKPQSAIEDGDIQIFPMGLNEIKEPLNTCSTQACKTLLNEINSAKTQILFAIYGIHNQDAIVNALINAQGRGVEVKWVTD